MINKNIIWENGSEFHMINDILVKRNNIYNVQHSLFRSGRDAIISLLNCKHVNRAWKRIFVPYYICPDLLYAIKNTKIQLNFYNDSPIEDDKNNLEKYIFKENDIILRINYYGLREFRSNKILKEKGVIIVEDHSHDPWSIWAKNSDADWCFASLRKILPLPDGGVLWSPLKKYLPNKESTYKNINSSNTKLLAMFLKDLYLKGLIKDKEYYLKLFYDGERNIYDSEISGINPISKDLLYRIPVNKIREIKQRNYLLFIKNIMNTDIEILKPESNKIIPYSIILILKNMIIRNKLYKYLISRNVYPAILWDLSKITDVIIPKRYLQLSNNLLSIHCDFRYSHNDMNKIAKIINEYHIISKYK